MMKRKLILPLILAAVCLVIFLKFGIINVENEKVENVGKIENKTPSSQEALQLKEKVENLLSNSKNLIKVDMLYPNVSTFKLGEPRSKVRCKAHLTGRSGEIYAFVGIYKEDDITTFYSSSRLTFLDSGGRLEFYEEDFDPYFGPGYSGKIFSPGKYVVFCGVYNCSEIVKKFNTSCNNANQKNVFTTLIPLGFNKKEITIKEEIYPCDSTKDPELCYFFVGSSLENKEYCKKSGGYVALCYAKIGEKKNNFEICEELEKENRNKCYLILARELNNEKLCEKIKDEKIYDEIYCKGEECSSFWHYGWEKISLTMKEYCIFKITNKRPK